MHQYLRLVLLCVGSMMMVACGQSGALQLPSDPKLDQRAKYLLYAPEAPSAERSASTPSESTESVEAP